MQFKSCLGPWSGITLPAHVPMSFHIPVVLSFADQVKEHVSIPEWKQEMFAFSCIAQYPQGGGVT